MYKKATDSKYNIYYNSSQNPTTNEQHIEFQKSQIFIQ